MENTLGILELRNLFLKHFSIEPLKIEKMPISGSNREYFLLSNNQIKCVGTIGKELKENLAFIDFTNKFGQINLNVPKILETSQDKMIYIQSFIEGKSLFETLGENKNPDGSLNQNIKNLYKKTITELIKFQVLGKDVIDFDKCYPRYCFDSQSVAWDFNYFKYYFLKTAHVFFDEQLLENDFKEFNDCICKEDNQYFLYRDFQSRNILVSPDNQVYFIDYQGGRKGALQYDIASLLYDGKAAILPSDKKELLDFYIDQVEKYVNIDEVHFRKMFNAFALARIMQACGSYGYRGFFENKSHFLQSIIPAMKNLEYLLTQDLPIEIPHLRECFNLLINSELINNLLKPKKKLVVRVESFSYKKGIPYDPTGNGGGFVFDCRAIHNPGKYQQYKNLTGKDKEVIEFLDKESDMQDFVSLVEQTIDISVKKYIKRGFENLAIFFGCTGGQHRSVYCAEHIADYLNKKYGNLIEVKLSHQNGW